nr:MAG TPA: hypothetical protein [Caudoviricetes sp.]
MRYLSRYCIQFFPSSCWRRVRDFLIYCFLR